MERPSFVFHAYDIKPKFYSMWQTMEGKPKETLGTVVSRIYGANVAAMHSPWGSSLKNVILNVHGSPGAIYIGGVRYGVTIRGDLFPFGILKESGIGTIWIIGCDVAREQVGKEFCKAMAQLTGSIVIASEYPQIVSFTDAVGLIMRPFGNYIDAYEGNVIAFHPNGTTQISNDPAELVSTIRTRPDPPYFVMPPR